MKSNMILSESKRDDLLLPYLDILKSKGINCTFGQFKSYMLRKLVNEANLRNLSLSSNFYLAGAVRYYFNGDLTTNKNLDIFGDGQTTNDVWKQDVCQKLNALINVLRNAYIDSVGESFEQPEDFGNLSIAKLLRKYNKKITAEIQNGLEDYNSVKDNLDRDNKVGNNYTFEILYNYKQATKYQEYTHPGAWCITWAKNHYNNYIKRLNIHYVIFKQDGFEKVERKFGPEWDSRKPQDEYGCSLIAVLQSNTTGEPVYITSRWNHGYEKSCEADHAFTKEEFFQKTGITDEDLKRIFNIWKKDAPLYSEDDYNEGGTITKQEKLSVLRKLKYAQMRINGGDLKVDDTIKVLTNLNGEQELINNDNFKINKGTFWCINAFESSNKFYFIIDRGKILFETITPSIMSPKCISSNINSNVIHKDFVNYNNLVVMTCKKYIILYDLRKHEIINIDGEYKFKCIPRNSNSKFSNADYYSVRLGKEQFALLNGVTNQPLKLPNGSSWINFIRTNTTNNSYLSVIGNSNLDATICWGSPGGILELIYDKASGERYFFDIEKRRFLDDDLIPKSTNENILYKLNSSFKKPGYISFSVGSKDVTKYDYNSKKIVLKGNELVNIDGVTEFKYIRSFSNNLIAFIPYFNTTNNSNYGFLYNIKDNVYLTNPETGAKFKSDEALSLSNNRLLFINDSKYINCRDYMRRPNFIYDAKADKFLYNQYNYPSKYTFLVESYGNNDGSGVVIRLNPNTESPYLYYNEPNNEIFTKDFRILNIQGVDNINNNDLDKLWSNTPLTDEIILQDDAQEYNINDIQQIVTEVIKRISNN